ncbi:DUF3152 domain-containing protein [Streptomyces sp. NPDC101194]|uniref:DUF3152 domain-containing protein n=1 Tax=Streptomyces sp. NPDC101194 TaxID=3366127 RepID=UPI0038186A24
MRGEERGRRARGRGGSRGAIRRARRRKTRIQVTGAVLVPGALLLCGALVWGPWSGGERASAQAETPSDRVAVPSSPGPGVEPGSPSTPGGPRRSASADDADADGDTDSGVGKGRAGKKKPEAGKRADESQSSSGSVPLHGSGEFVTAAPAHTGSHGTGTVHRYRVEVERGTGLATRPAAAAVSGVFADPRGWTRTGHDAFRQVGSGPAGLVIRIATPDTVDRLCGAYGLNTHGEVNCRVGTTVVVNLKRWMRGSPQFDGPLGEYRALIINHEVGHWLGHGHETCPGPGRRAPAMMQQIDGLKGCVANAWPYTSAGTYLRGPSVP